MTRSDTAAALAEGFANEHGLILRYEPALPAGVPAYKYESTEGPVIVLDENMPPERRNFALAHETAHILLNHSGGVAPDEELEANHLASELLLPDKAFSQHAGLPLRELKELFPHVSYEVLARRKLAFVQGVVTIIDNGHISRRLTSDDFTAPFHPTEIEWNAIEECESNRNDYDIHVDDMHLSACYIDSGDGFIRVVLTVEQEWVP